MTGIVAAIKIDVRPTRTRLVRAEASPHAATQRSRPVGSASASRRRLHGLRRQILGLPPFPYVFLPERFLWRTRQPQRSISTMSQFQPDTHSKTIGYLLWIFGFTGAHRFYYGKPITGVLWFLTLGLAGIGWLIDLFLIPGMDRRADLRFTAGRYDYSVAWLLQTFLGLLGIHRLYLGKIWTGILWMLTAGLFGVGWIYDFCTLNSQVDERNRA